MTTSHLKSRIFKFLILNCSVLILLLAACGRKSAVPESEPVPIPPVNDFTMKNLASEFPGEIRTSNYLGQVQLVLFFRSDDAACRGSLSDWTALQEEFAPRGFTLIGAVADARHPDELAAEVAPLGISWPVGLADAPILTAFGGPAAIRAIPTAFLIRRDGTIARTYAGFEPIQNLQEDIRCLLDEQALPDRNPKTVAPEDNAA